MYVCYDFVVEDCRSALCSSFFQCQVNLQIKLLFFGSYDEVPHTGAAAAPAGHLLQGIPGARPFPVLRQDEAMARAVHAPTTQIGQGVDASFFFDFSQGCGVQHLPTPYCVYGLIDDK